MNKKQLCQDLKQCVEVVTDSFKNLGIRVVNVSIVPFSEDEKNMDAYCYIEFESLDPHGWSSDIVIKANLYDCDNLVYQMKQSETIRSGNRYDTVRFWCEGTLKNMKKMKVYPVKMGVD